jgi:CDP-diacylglycerol--serine O-phosphatidyltransferase
MNLPSSDLNALSVNEFKKNEHDVKLLSAKSHAKSGLKGGLKLLPNLFTLGNAFFGFCSIVCAASGKELILSSAYFILLGALMDCFDGRVARMTGNTSKLGMELDSLADATTFCLAPAFLAYQWQLNKLGILGLVVCALFFLSGILRLARFNVLHKEQTSSFIGLPSTIAASFLAVLLITINTSSWQTLASDFPLIFAFVILALAAAMVSALDYPTFKHVQMGGRIYVILLLGTIGGAIAFGFSKILITLFVLYLLAPIFKLIFIKKIKE